MWNGFLKYSKPSSNFPNFIFENLELRTPNNNLERINFLFCKDTIQHILDVNI